MWQNVHYAGGNGAKTVHCAGGNMAKKRLRFLRRLASLAVQHANFAQVVRYHMLPVRDRVSITDTLLYVRKRPDIRFLSPS